MVQIENIKLAILEWLELQVSLPPLIHGGRLRNLSMENFTRFKMLSVCLLNVTYVNFLLRFGIWNKD